MADIYPDDNLTVETIVLYSVFSGLATIAVACRFTARKLKGLPFWLDDWTALLALLLAWAIAGSILAPLRNGLGRHSNEISKEDLVEIRKCIWVSQIFYVLCPTVVKLSALLLYRRIFISPKFSRLVLFMIALIIVWGLISLFISVFNCRPVEAFWSGKGGCINLRTWAIGFAVPNILFDFIVWLMPLPMIWRLQLPLNQKIGLTVVFVVGLADCAAAIVRIATQGQGFDDPDFSYGVAISVWWSIIHSCLGVIAICLPTIRILILKCVYSSIIRRLFGLDPISKTESSLSSSVTPGGVQKPPVGIPYNVAPFDKKRTLSASDDTGATSHSDATALPLHQLPPHANASDIDQIQITKTFTVEDEEAGPKLEDHIAETIAADAL